VLRELCDPILPNTLNYEQVCNTLRKQFSPKLAVFRERTKFYELKQSNNQSINEWYVYIKKAAMNCKFGSHLLEILKDKFVTWLQKGPILDRLCEEEPDKTLFELVEIAQKREASIWQSKEVAFPINKVHPTLLKSKSEERRGANRVNQRTTGQIQTNNNHNATTQRTIKIHVFIAVSQITTSLIVSISHISVKFVLRWDIWQPFVEIKS